MYQFVVYIFSAVGAANIITHSTIMEPLRNWVHNHVSEHYAQGIDCSQCIGFWMGLVSGLVFMPLHGWLAVPESILYGAAGSFAASLSANIMGYLEAQSYVDMGDGK